MIPGRPVKLFKDGRNWALRISRDFKHCWQQSKQVASAAVIVDAKDEAAKHSYEHFDFIPLPDTPRRLFLPMRTIENLFRDDDRFNPKVASGCGRL